MIGTWKIMISIPKLAASILTCVFLTSCSSNVSGFSTLGRREIPRPDIYFELTKHCVIVEIDENQHNSYQDSCECARINEIVSGIGGKSVIMIRYNPDTIKNKGKKINISNAERIDLLVTILSLKYRHENQKFVYF